MLHVYRNGDRLLACTPQAAGTDRTDLDCWETSRNELAGIVTAMAFTEEELLDRERPPASA